MSTLLKKKKKLHVDFGGLQENFKDLNYGLQKVMGEE